MMRDFLYIALGTVIGFAILILAFVFFVTGDAWGEDLIPPTPEEYKSIQSWISSTCCWTNNCCFKVKASALTAVVPFNDEWRVNETGQVLKRTGWSRDGQTWRCTCDPVGSTWVAHPKANTRCIFPVANGS